MKISTTYQVKTFQEVSKIVNDELANRKAKKITIIILYPVKAVQPLNISMLKKQYEEKAPEQDMQAAAPIAEKPAAQATKQNAQAEMPVAEKIEKPVAQPAALSELEQKKIRAKYFEHYFKRAELNELNGMTIEQSGAKAMQDMAKIVQKSADRNPADPAVKYLSKLSAAELAKAEKDKGKFNMVAPWVQKATVSEKAEKISKHTKSLAKQVKELQRAFRDKVQNHAKQTQQKVKQQAPQKTIQLAPRQAYQQTLQNKRSLAPMFARQKLGRVA